jgi:hypothetical protein
MQWRFTGSGALCPYSIAARRGAHTAAGEVNVGSANGGSHGRRGRRTRLALPLPGNPMDYKGGPCRTTSRCA